MMGLTQLPDEDMRSDIRLRLGMDTFCADICPHINADVESLRSQEKQALKIVRFQRHLPLTIQFYISCRITGVPPLQSDFYGLSSALKDDTNEPKKRKETRTKPTKMARKKSTLRTTTSTLLLHTLRTPTSATHSKEASL
jgi:hypothetical protein